MHDHMKYVFFIFFICLFQRLHVEFAVIAEFVFVAVGEHHPERHHASQSVSVPVTVGLVVTHIITRAQYGGFLLRHHYHRHCTAAIFS